MGCLKMARLVLCVLLIGVIVGSVRTEGKEDDVVFNKKITRITYRYYMYHYMYILKIIITNLFFWGGGDLGVFLSFNS